MQPPESSKPVEPEEARELYRQTDHGEADVLALARLKPGETQG